MRALKHVGKQPLKFSFEAYICDVRGLPNDVSQVAISWERGGKQTATTRTVITQTTGAEERTAMLDETLRLQCTLYRSARRATFDAKPTLIRVLDMSGGPYATPAVLGTADFELSEHADLNADSPAKSKQLRLPRALLRRGDGTADMLITLQMTIQSRWLQGESSDEREYPKLDGGGSSNASGSAASSALTHEALQALDASHVAHSTTSSNPSYDPSPQQRNSDRAPTHHRSASFGRAEHRGLKAKESSRIAELSHLVAAAAADARAAESRLAACQFRLRTEVMDTLESHLKECKDFNPKKADELARLHQKQLVSTLDQVGRIAGDNGGSIAAASGASRGGGVSPLEAEVLSLRRELADSKVEVARLMGEKDELDHVAKVLNKQLAELARGVNTAR